MTHQKKAVLLLPGVLAVIVGAFFGSAGRWDLPLAWGAIGVYAAFMVALQFLIDPELLQERMNPGPGGTDRQIRWAMLPFMLGFWIVAGLDIRWHGTDRMAVGWQLLGFAGLAGSLSLTMWAMIRNRFFSPVVRIQTERSHHLVTTGPYRFIRHPGYLGSLGAAIFGALALGSWWALLPAAGCAGVIVRRTVLEDRFLHRELPGYPEYARKVRHRLLPGIW